MLFDGILKILFAQFGISPLITHCLLKFYATDDPIKAYPLLLSIDEEHALWSMENPSILAFYQWEWEWVDYQPSKKSIIVCPSRADFCLFTGLAHSQ
jgi:hypothetical protein